MKIRSQWRNSFACVVFPATFLRKGIVHLTYSHNKVFYWWTKRKIDVKCSKCLFLAAGSVSKQKQSEPQFILLGRTIISLLVIDVGHRLNRGRIIETQPSGLDHYTSWSWTADIAFKTLFISCSLGELSAKGCRVRQAPSFSSQDRTMYRKGQRQLTIGLQSAEGHIEYEKEVVEMVIWRGVGESHQSDQHNPYLLSAPSSLRQSQHLSSDRISANKELATTGSPPLNLTKGLVTQTELPI